MEEHFISRPRWNQGRANIFLPYSKEVLNFNKLIRAIAFDEKKSTIKCGKRNTCNSYSHRRSRIKGYRFAVFEEFWLHHFPMESLRELRNSVF